MDLIQPKSIFLAKKADFFNSVVKKNLLKEHISYHTLASGCFYRSWWTPCPRLTLILGRPRSESPGGWETV
jgi:hypothetical protein